MSSDLDGYRLSPDILSTLRMKGHVLHRALAHSVSGPANQLIRQPFIKEARKTAGQTMLSYSGSHTRTR